HTRTDKATTSSDVYSFSAFLLEVTCWRRLINPKALVEDPTLVDCVFSFWTRGENEILEAVDTKLGNDFVVAEMELVLKLGLLCRFTIKTV
ncbi:hypothetical protein U1Q18_010847, partial [Sarracenia purpurea var. burkii]